MRKKLVYIEWLPHFRKWRAWNKFAESWYKTFDDFLDSVKRNNLTNYYYFFSYTERTRKRLAKYKLLKEEDK